METYFGDSAEISNDKSIHTNVVIIGAGPAGAASSIFLTKAGINHVIIEKATFPRDKICGDACSGKTVFVLRKANPAWVDDIFKNTDENISSHGVIFAVQINSETKLNKSCWRASPLHILIVIV
jgi:flavin-dependent dehydrogenase